MKGGYRVLNTIGLFVLGSFFFFTFPQGKNNKKSDNRYWVAAYIWPSCHHDERFGNMLWPEGIGEWEVIKKGTPRFEGHYQPRLPLWGYELDNDPKVVEKWIDVAIDHGVNVFVYDWYWYDGGPFLESALNDGFLKAKNNSKMQFYIMWANHDVKRNYWNVHKFKDDTSLLWKGAVDWENFKIIVDRVIKQYFKQPNYFKIDGKPVFSIFSIENLLESFGGSVEETRKALDYFRGEVKKAGFPDLHIQWNQGGGSVMSKDAAGRFSQRVKDMGFNSVAMYNMGGLNEDYLVYGSNSLKIRAQLDSILDIPVFPCVSIGWDDTPRFPAKGKKDVVHYHNTPVSFASLLFKAKEYANNHPDQPKLITINAWNEWVEGSYLLPDMLNGFGYLKAVKKVFGNKPIENDTAEICMGTNAKWIGAIKKEDSHIPEGRNYHALAATSEAAKKWQQTHPLSKRSIYLRKPFETRGKVKSAILYICGLGHYELSLNGEKVGDDQFAPLWSDYDKTVYYNAYDVTENIETKNTIGVLLGNGFYNEQGGRYVKMQVSFGPPTLFFNMQLTYEDGSTEEIVSDESWKYSLSPIVFNDMYGGEDYDARLEQKGWNTWSFDDSGWQRVVVQEPPKGKLTPQTAPPVKIMETYSIKEIKKGKNFYTLDMGQNLSGFPLIRVSGKKGDKIRLIVGENLNEDGSVNQSQSGAPHYYEYTLKGEGEEIWHPRFSYYGYRYIQVEGGEMKNSKDDSDLPIINDVKSCFVYNSAPQTGYFYCSNSIFNDAHRIIVNAMKSNFQAVFTDCPHREKLGWLEQVHLNGPGLFYNFNLTTFAPKIMRDIRDAQLPNGLVPDIAPEYVVFEGGFRDSPEWGSTAVILPFLYYQYYGDHSLIIEYYDVMKKYVDYLSTTAKNHIVSHGLGDWYDYNEEFPAGPSRNTPIALSATTHYYMDIDYLTKAAAMLGKTDDVAYYTDLKEKVKEAFNKEFFDPKTAQYGTGSQASHAMPLYAGLVDSQYKQAVLDNLVKDIEKHNYKLTTGDVGNRYLFQVLAENGLNEIMYKMHNHKEVPGYGFQVQFGATTLTEQWDPRKGNSWNHFMMGQIEEWFYKSLAGITVDKEDYSGFRNIIIAPQVVGDLKFVEASYTTLHGTIEVNWKIENNIFTVNVAIPTNCSAKVYLPKEHTFKKVGSGKYSFSKTL